jgi:predicted secreted protein
MVMGMKIGRVGMLAVAGLVLAVAGHAQSGSVDASKTAPQSVAITEEQNGQSFNVGVGDEVDVTFVAAQGTGYSWQLETISPEVATLSNEETVPIPPSMPGSPAKQVFHLKIVAAGKVTLHFDYLRPWESAANSAKTFTVKLRAE